MPIQTALLKFQSTLPARGATTQAVMQAPFLLISIHAPRTGSDALPVRLARRSKISIHAPRTGSDGDTSQPRRLGSISIHAPRTGSDHYLRSGRLYASRFQSTLPARGATPVLSGRVPVLIYFNPRSPHGERPLRTALSVSPSFDFNPRSPHGERLSPKLTAFLNIFISIHAPRTGSDSISSAQAVRVESFQSTLPARGATFQGAFVHHAASISIHAPRTGSDVSGSCISCNWHYFNPRSPHGERPNDLKFVDTKIRISIHAPRTGSDAIALPCRRSHSISIHAPRTGSDCMWMTSTI